MRKIFIFGLRILLYYSFWLVGELLSLSSAKKKQRIKHKYRGWIAPGAVSRTNKSSTLQDKKTIMLPPPRHVRIQSNLKCTPNSPQTPFPRLNDAAATPQLAEFP